MLLFHLSLSSFFLLSLQHFASLGPIILLLCDNKHIIKDVQRRKRMKVEISNFEQAQSQKHKYMHLSFTYFASWGLYCIYIMCIEWPLKKTRKICNISGYITYTIFPYSVLECRLHVLQFYKYLLEFQNPFLFN